MAQNTPGLGAPSVVQVGHRRHKLGDMEVIALNDGVTRRPLQAEFLANAPLDQVQALLRSQNLPTDYIDVPYTPFLIVASNRRVADNHRFCRQRPGHHRPPAGQYGYRRLQGGGH